MILRSYCRKAVIITPLSISVLILISIPAYSQKFSLGAKGGALVSWTHYPDKDHRAMYDTKGKVGFFAAGLINFPLKNDYSCQIEGGFSQRGRKVEYDFDASTNSFTSVNNATYLYYDAALLLRRSFKMHVLKNVPTNWFVNIGPHISRWISGKGKYGNVEYPSQSYRIVFDQSRDPASLGSIMYLNDVNRWLFALDIGVGFDAPFSKTQHIAAELRFSSGHTFFGNELSANVGGTANFNDKNLKANEKILSLSVAYTFDFDIQKSRTGHSTKDKDVKRKPVRRKR
ncbi:MAG: PorT family protein [Flammeovirgaceae bacterium]|nr:PorT family protein [Flammeovirgaceae bacterium]